MISSTQTMANTTEVEYISIYDKPKRGKGRPRGSKYTDEEKQQQRREIALKHYYDNWEYKRLYKEIYNETKSKHNKQNV